MPDTIYCIDTSALIDLKRLYPMDVFPGLWREITALARSDRLIAPKEVLNEIKKKDDEVLKWAKKNKRIFKRLDSNQIVKVQEICRRFPTLVDPLKEIPEADPFVIALAMVEAEAQRQNLFGGQCIVVTQEIPARGEAKKKIPDVCNHYEIECIGLLELFRRENWKFG
jgi:hypothetical protein